MSKIGRDLRKSIIVDNMPQNFRLQKDNGIFIKTFWGEDNKDTALIDLIPILANVGKAKPKDIRKCLMEYREEILRNVSSNLNKKN
jgi:CTD small phosphatase-like protein 2